MTKQIDQNSLSVFAAMGYDPDKIPQTLVNTYHAVKTRKDVVFPGKMSPELCAVVSVIADMVDGRIDLREAAEPVVAAPVVQKAKPKDEERL
jgi:hypothetical protein